MHSHDEFRRSLPGVITLLLKDHRAMRVLMKKIKSSRATKPQIFSAYAKLEKLVNSHMKAEELALLNPIIEHPRFHDEARESYEEHRIHEHIFVGIGRLKDPTRKAAQMQIYCEILQHHLKEEEHDLFPKYKKYFALSTRKKAGKKFLRKRQQTSRKADKLGALQRS